MYIAMNRFKIYPGKENEFEKLWKERDSHLDGVATINIDDPKFSRKLS